MLSYAHSNWGVISISFNVSILIVKIVQENQQNTSF